MSSTHSNMLRAVALLVAAACLSGRDEARAQAGDALPPTVRVTDARLAGALHELVAGSPSAARVVDALRASGLEVVIGTPAGLASLPDSAGGPANAERRALLAEASGAGDAATAGGGAAGGAPPVAWVALRVAPPAHVVERVWVVVEVDSIERWIRTAGWADAAERIRADLLATLGHEFVAHVGSIAASRRLADFCDDPPAASATVRVRDLDALACSIRVENRVRRELNHGLSLRGAARLPQRASYALDVMHFAQARAARGR